MSEAFLFRVGTEPRLDVPVVVEVGTLLGAGSEANDALCVLLEGPVGEGSCPAPVLMELRIELRNWKLQHVEVANEVFLNLRSFHLIMADWKMGRGATSVCSKNM